MKYSVYYKLSSCSVWTWHGIYTKTDALGTANLCLKAGYDVQIECEEK